MMKHFVYADNAATSQLSPGALEAMLPWLKEEYANASQPYTFSRKPKKAIADARETIADCIGASPEEIFFSSCGTESNNWVIQRALNNLQCKGIITSNIEHHAVLRACEAAEKYFGATVDYLQVQNDGAVNVDSLSATISQSHGLVSIMTANNEIGTIQPVCELAEISHGMGCLFHTDAVQAIGHIPVNVKDSGVDFLSASAHKFNGPKGIGFLFVKKGVFLPPLIYGGGQESGFRAGTENVASIVGMATALAENVSELENNILHISDLESSLLHQLDEAGVRYHRNGSKNHIPGNISLSFEGFEGEAILHRLDLLGIHISTGSACDSKETKISHVLQAIGLEPDLAKGTIRISLGKNNTQDDVQIIAKALKKVIAR